MRYLLIGEGGDVSKTSIITEDILDELREGIITVIDTTTVMECYYLDNDHQPVWEVILERTIEVLEKL